MTLDLVAIARQTLKLTSDWYIGALTAAGVAATVVPAGERLAAALLTGGAVIAFGAYKTAPCCPGCAAGAGCAGASSAPPPPPPKPVTLAATFAAVYANPGAPAAMLSLPAYAATPMGATSC